LKLEEEAEAPCTSVMVTVQYQGRAPCDGKAAASFLAIALAAWR